MAYTTIGVLFVCIFGIKIGYEALWLYSDEEAWSEGEGEKLFGNPIRFNLTGHLVPVTEMNDYELDGVKPREHHLPEAPVPIYSAIQRRMVIFMALTCVAVLLSLGILTIMHARQITRGETSIESYINKDETERMAKMGKKYVNPYDFGSRENWRQFLGLRYGRSFFSHVVLPSRHLPDGDGITFRSIYDSHEWT